MLIKGDNLEVLSSFDDKIANLIYIDPPFNTGKKQTLHEISYEDQYENYKSFIVPRFEQAYRILALNGSLFVHLDYREVHYCKVWLDEIFGSYSFINEIIWVYDYGARSKSKWSAKHDNILFYAKNPKDYTFHYDEIERIPYMAPGLVGPEKAARGKTLTDTWWHTIVSPTARERTGYPTQKPLEILSRIIRVHTNPGDLVIDFFAGSGTTGEAAGRLGRKFILIDEHDAAIEIMKKRLKKWQEQTPEPEK